MIAPARAQENYNIVDIQVVGNRIATTSLILGSSSLAKGTPLTQAAVQETIRRLYGLGIFSDVDVEAEPVTGGLKVSIVVKELPRLTGLEFSGNKKIKTSELKEKLKLGVGGYISPYLIYDKKEEIKKLYADKGYFRAEVTPVLTYSSDSSDAVLKYNIDERSKVKVDNVVMTGNSRVEAGQLIGKMRNRHRGFLKSSDFVQEKYEEDLKKVADEYHNLGFIDAYIISDSTVTDTLTNRMTIYLNVYEGPKYYFGKTEFKNNQAIPTPKLAHVLKYKEGDVFDADEYQKSLYEIYTAYQDIGHLHVRVADEKSTRADSIIDISYDITEGLPSHVNMVKIVGNTKTKDHVIRREITMYPGDVFNRALVVRSARDIMALNYFANVEPSPIDLPNGDIDLEFKIQEKQTGQISAGAGYNSTDKLVGNLGLGIPNLAGNGQNLSFNVEFGSSRHTFSVSFTEPWLFGRPTSLGTQLYTENRRWYDDYTEGRQGGSIQVGRRLRWPDNYFRVYGAATLERNRFYDYSDAFQNASSYTSTFWWDYNNSGALETSSDSLKYTARYAPLPGSILEYNEKWLTSARLAFTIMRDSRNLPEFATRGSQLSYTIENTGGFLGGYWHYQKHSLSLAKFIPIIGNIALAAKVQYGVVTSPEGDDHILVTDRFTPGGVGYDGIIRGYDDGTLTPDSIYSRITDTTYFYSYADSAAARQGDRSKAIDTTYVSSTTTRVRGKYMLVTNWELQIPIARQQLYGLIFFDAGNSWLYRKNIKPITGLYKGVGFGFRIVVPGVGTIGFDFGYPLDHFAGQKQAWKPHFQIGTTFR